MVTVDYFSHVTTPVLWFVVLQLAVALLDRLLSTLSNIVQQLLQERVSNRVQLLILEKANTLDLAFFENSEFYDKLRRAAEESNYKPVMMIAELFDLVRTVVTLASMLFLLLQLAWWLALVAIAAPIPAFFASSRYGWQGYQMMRRQSPERRKQWYLNMVMTVDDFNKEIKLFNLGPFFINRYKYLADKFYNQNKTILVRRYLTGFFWSGLSIAANSAIYIYVALQTIAGRISLGSLTLYTQTAIQVGQNFQGFLDGLSSTYENNLFVSTLFEFLEYKPVITSPEQPSPVPSCAVPVSSSSTNQPVHSTPRPNTKYSPNSASSLVAKPPSSSATASAPSASPTASSSWNTARSSKTAPTTNSSPWLVAMQNCLIFKRRRTGDKG